MQATNALHATAAPHADEGGADASTGAFERLQALVANDLEAVNALIRDRMVSDSAPLIPELAAHLISAGGKRLRPILTLAAAQLCDYRGRHHIGLAATVEFIHTATLLHDDVVDESDRRRGRASANMLWGNKPSILVGDFLFSRSFQLMVDTGSIAVLGVLANASTVIAEGEVLQLSTVNRLADDDVDYMRVIRAKTAALFEAATRVGAMIADADPAREEALAVYGESLGVAFQLVDDALDYGGASARLGKSVGDDFREGKATLPSLIAYQRGDADAAAFWKRVIEKRVQTDGDFEEAVARLQATGALEETIERARAHAQRARDALTIFPETPLKAALSDVVDFVVDRAT